MKPETRKHKAEKQKLQAALDEANDRNKILSDRLEGTDNDLSAEQRKNEVMRSNLRRVLAELNHVVDIVPPVQQMTSVDLQARAEYLREVHRANSQAGGCKCTPAITPEPEQPAPETMESMRQRMGMIEGRVQVLISSLRQYEPTNACESDEARRRRLRGF